MAENPLAWEPRLRAYSLDEAFERTVAANGQAYYRYLHSLVRVLLPRTVLELGTCQGGSALFMLLALPEGSSLTTLDLGSRLGSTWTRCGRTRG
jgi:predicted O-methyltransferase YrrM